MKKRYLLIALILSGLVFSYLYEPSLNTLASRQGVADTAAPLNFYMKDLETRTFNAVGEHTNTLTSIYATQQTGREEIQLEQPVMLIALHAAPWTAHANKGISSKNMKKISLKDDVLLSRIDGIADVTTETLVFDSTDEVAYTPSPVEILARGSRTTANGVFIDLNREIIHLKNKVRTHYVPEVARPHHLPSLH